ncbi:hypothetical protein ACFL7M_02180 [Thermodesulfobacteriota bacterium]
MKLALGCGRNQLTLPPGRVNKNEWLSVDIRPEIQPDILTDFTKLDREIEPETADEIYSCHSLEHIERELVVPTLLSWWTVLKQGGKLTIRVPDFN